MNLVDPVNPVNPVDPVSPVGCFEPVNFINPINPIDTIQRGSYGFQIWGADNKMGQIFGGAEPTIQPPHSTKRAEYWGCCSTRSPPYNYLTASTYKIIRDIMH